MMITYIFKDTFYYLQSILKTSLLEYLLVEHNIRGKEKHIVSEQTINQKTNLFFALSTNTH